MKNSCDYDDIDPNEIDELVEELPSSYFEEENQKIDITSNDDIEEVEFADIIRELKYQLRFTESSRKFLNIKIQGKKHRVIPITEFKISGSFIFKTDNGEMIKAKKSDISK